MPTGVGDGYRSADSTPVASRPDRNRRGWPWLASRLFAREEVNETVVTCLHIGARPEAVWGCLLFYEEVPGTPPLLLRALLPRVLRTEGEKSRPGAKVRCVYRGGELVKRIERVEPPHFLEFVVVEQQLGIEDCVQTVGGSYRIRNCGDGADALLITRYRARLWPRRFWRVLETIVARQLHRHILHGVNAAVSRKLPAVDAAAAAAPGISDLPPGSIACIASLSSSRR